MLPSIHQRPTALGGPPEPPASEWTSAPSPCQWRGVPAGRGEVFLSLTGAAIPRLQAVVNARLNQRVREVVSIPT